MDNLDNELPIVDDENVYDKPTKSIPVPKPNIGIEEKNNVVNDILQSDNSSRINTSAINSFLDVSRNRDTQYGIIDQMCQDSIPSAILESFSEDATATNEEKKSIWCVSEDPKISKTVQFIIDSLQLNKNIHKYATSFIKYGDVYLRLYKQSEYEQDPLFDKNKKKEKLNEDINLHVTPDSDHLVPYVELIDNPATMFELTRFGKTAGFIQTHIDLKSTNSADAIKMLGNNIYQYSFNQSDVDIYQPTDFVHASLDDDVDRAVEEVKIILNNNIVDNKYKDKSVVYKVKSGQSLFYNTYRVWREISLLENSLLLSRLTKSSITRVIQVETGNVAKEEVSQILQSVKQMVEQKAALNPGNNMAEYTNPGPIENNIYMATHDGKGAITTSQIGGDYDPKQLTDLDYFKNQFWGAFGIPKQYFGDTDDSTGFNGGTSLSIISSKYAKKIIKIQSALIQMITTLINIFLIDKGLSKYINKFTIKMLEPTTQEDIDRKEVKVNNIRIISDTMSLLSDIDSKSTRLKILQSLIPTVIDNNDIINILDQEIDKLEQDENSEENTESSETNEDEFESNFENTGLDLDSALNLGEEEPIEEPIETEISQPENQEQSPQLPTPAETGVDLLNM